MTSWQDVAVLALNLGGLVTVIWIINRPGS